MEMAIDLLSDLVPKAFAVAFVEFYALWIFYLALMAARRAQLNQTLTPFARTFGAPIVLAGFVLDFASNIFILTLILLEPPQELLVTTRLRRHFREEGWRGDVARWFGRHLLDPFDPTGTHLG
jgi:hypothetical protein